MPKTYTTVQGDTWDVISLKSYGSELFTDKLIAANFQQRNVGIFGSGTVINIPDVTAQQVIQTNLPPWRRRS